MVHYRIHRCPALVHILSQIDPIHVLPSNFFKIPFNIILPSRPSKSPLSLRFSHQNSVCASSLAHTCYILRQTHSSWYGNPLQNLVRNTDLNNFVKPIVSYPVLLQCSCGNTKKTHRSNTTSYNEWRTTMIQVSIQKKSSSGSSYKNF